MKTINEDYLQHSFGDSPNGYSRAPKYVAKVGRWPNARYFYTEQEYLRYLNKNKAPATGMDEEREKEQAQTTKKAEEFKQKIKTPDKVSVKDYLFGGQYAKDLSKSKSQLKKTQKAIKNDEKEADSILKQIKRLESKNSLSASQRARLSTLRERHKALYANITKNLELNDKYKREVVISTIRYEQATLVGQISKKIKNTSSKLNKLLQKVGNKAVSTINAPVISIKKK